MKRWALILLLAPSLAFGQAFSFRDLPWMAKARPVSGGGGGNGLLTSLTAVWDMEQADASNAADATGGGFTLTVHGATSRRTTHIEGSFANSGGPSAYWDTSSSTLKTTGNFSIAMWFNTQTLNDDGAFIIERWNGTTPVWALYDNSGVITFFIRKADNSGNYSAASTVAVNNNNWHLVVFTYNSSTKVGKISIDNETLVASATTDGLNTDTRNFTLGATVFYMDETAYWDGRVLSQSDIGVLYASGAGLFYSGGGWTN